MDIQSNIKQNQKLWRYMDFSKFVWLIQNNALWLARSDLLGDPWEISLSGEQLKHVIQTAPITIAEKPQKETTSERIDRILTYWRKNTFVNCWNMSKHESNALWNIYCSPNEGVVVQTDFKKLDSIKNHYKLSPVTYPIPGANKKTPTHSDLVTKKRPMFKYEEEIRLYYFDEKEALGSPDGILFEFDVCQIVESIRIHPKAKDMFFEIIESLINKYLPEFKGKISWSDMKVLPPY